MTFSVKQKINRLTLSTITLIVLGRHQVQYLDYHVRYVQSTPFPRGSSRGTYHPGPPRPGSGNESLLCLSVGLTESDRTLVLLGLSFHKYVPEVQTPGRERVHFVSVQGSNRVESTVHVGTLRGSQQKRLRSVHPNRGSGQDTRRIWRNREGVEGRDRDRR